MCNAEPEEIVEESKESVYHRRAMHGVNYGGDNAYPDAFPYNQSSTTWLPKGQVWGLQRDLTIW